MTQVLEGGGFSVCSGVPSAYDVRDGLELHDAYAWHLPGGIIRWGDSRLLLPSIEAGSVSCIVTDPAYWTLDKWRTIGTTTRLGGALKAESRDEAKWFQTIDLEDLQAIIDEASRVLAPDGVLWMWGDDLVAAHIRLYAELGEHHSFVYAKSMPVVKVAGTGGLKAGMGYNYRASCEHLVLLKKGRRFRRDGSLNPSPSSGRALRSGQQVPDAFAPLWCGDAETRPHTPHGQPYPTAKPLAFTQWLIEESTQPGETVLDPFLGSGTTALACARSGRKCLGMDVSPRAIETTFNRLRDHASRLPLEAATP